MGADIIYSGEADKIVALRPVRLPASRLEVAPLCGKNTEFGEKQNIMEEEETIRDNKKNKRGTNVQFALLLFGGVHTI